MNVQPIKDVVVIRRTNKEISEVPEPKWHCASCLKLKEDNKCDCFNRRVEPNFNRCFYHSHYSPVVASFKAPTNLEEIVKQEEERRIA